MTIDSFSKSLIPLSSSRMIRFPKTIGIFCVRSLSSCYFCYNSLLVQIAVNDNFRSLLLIFIFVSGIVVKNTMLINGDYHCMHISTQVLNFWLFVNRRTCFMTLSRLILLNNIEIHFIEKNSLFPI